MTTTNEPPVAVTGGTTTSSDPATKRSILLLFAGLMVTMLLSALDQTIFSTALPTIVGELDGVNHMLWVTTAYILAATIMMPVYGKLGDLIGRKGLFIGAISIFMAGSIVGGLAPDMTWLIVGRAVQGLGGGGLMILSQAIIADVVPARERGRYMGAIGGVFALASVAGPLLGGWFTESIGWRWAFWMNLPLGALAIFAAVMLLKLPKNTRGKPTIDVAGMILLAIASTAIVLVTTWGGTQYDWDSLIIIGLIALAVVSAFSFVMVERAAAEPIMPLHMFKERNFVLTTASGLITGIAMFGALAYMPTYLQMVTGVNATQAGFLMIPMMGAMLVTSIVAGQLVSRTGRYKWLPLTGSFVIATGLALLSTMTPDLPIWILCSYLAVMGLGLGMSMQMLVLIVQNTFPNAQVGTATSSNNYFRQIGASIGTAVVGSLFVARLTELLDTRLPAAAAGATGDTNSLTPAAVRNLPDAVREVIVGAYNDSLAPVFLYMVPLVLVSAVLLMFIKEVPLATTIDRAEPTETLNVLGDEDAVDALPSDAESHELTNVTDRSGPISIIRSQP
ncbi:DHA2 family efflux MFS transporter permease subunit [Salinibacterium sp. UTAS2018]|uniref:MDR family MFS transporter n=1 Tax=Salinibacterium sp. UTAS2018 TaxID=2508880 RepID=UPI0010096EE7|nr:MDR family MFS transporter [Salinibacterium sp. UTAS2018]QAV69903.1 DHA2 family efflux MFS transporter permease subunit [Salinibacterium sp. UTAS2018]